jgi:hypothetical protein
LTAQAPVWATSSYGETTDTTPMELAALSAHMVQCTAKRGRLVAVQCGVLRLHGFVSARLVTTLAFVAALTGACLVLVL